MDSTGTDGASTEIDDVIWPAPDGSCWIYTAKWAEWTGWESGVDGHFQYTIEQFRKEYPDAPDWDENERQNIDPDDGRMAVRADPEATTEREG